MTSPATNRRAPLAVFFIWRARHPTLGLLHESVPALLGDWRHRLGSDGADGTRPPWPRPRGGQTGRPWGGRARPPGRAGGAAPPRGQAPRDGGTAAAGPHHGRDAFLSRSSVSN